MFGRGALFIAVIAMAVAIPYFLTDQESGPGQRLARIRDSMFELEDPNGQPIPSASPVPARQSRRRDATGAVIPRTTGVMPSPSSMAGSARPAGSASWSPSAGAVPGTSQFASQPPQDGSQLRHFSDLFRFDITPEWVVQNWPRVSSQLAEFSFSGLRVPVVSGTSIHDLAGSLTYYFDSQQRLQRTSQVFQWLLLGPRPERHAS